jgi:hypothetical protein
MLRDRTSGNKRKHQGEKLKARENWKASDARKVQRLIDSLIGEISPILGISG